MEFYVAGAVISAVASWKGSQAASDAAAAQARIARQQAEISERHSRFAARMQLKSGRQEAVFRRRESRRAAAGAVVSVAGSGVEISGSPIALIGERMRRDELNAAQVVTNAQARSFTERAKGRAAAVGFRASAGALDAQARIARVTGWIDTIGAGMSAVGGFYARTSSSNTQTGNRFEFDNYG